MKGTIIIPKYYLSRQWSSDIIEGKEDFSNVSRVMAILFYAMRDSFGFDLKFADEISVSPDTDVVVLFGVPYHNRPKMIPGLLDLNPKIKLITYPGDIQCYNDPTCIENKIKVFNRSNLIVSGSYEYFSKIYPQFMGKYKFLPLFFGPHKRYVELPFNEAPKMRCLLSGAINPTIYPSRAMLRKARIERIDYRSTKHALGDAYAKLLNSYFCCVATPSIFNYANAKHFEIPAAGSLLIAIETEDLKRAGFIANRHYVSVTKDTIIAQITQCLDFPEEYEHIRIEGMRFARKNHSVVNRINVLKEIFKEMKI